MLERIKRRSKFMRPMIFPLILYIGLLAFSVSMVEGIENENLQVGIALLPLIPGLWLAIEIVKMVNKLDELERKEMQEASTFAFYASFLTVTALTFLKLTDAEPFNMLHLSVIMSFYIVVGKFRAMRRYQ